MTSSDNNTRIRVTKIDGATFMLEYHKDETSFVTLMTLHKAISLMDNLKELLEK